MGHTIQEYRKKHIGEFLHSEQGNLIAAPTKTFVTATAHDESLAISSGSTTSSTLDSPVLLTMSQLTHLLQGYGLCSSSFTGHSNVVMWLVSPSDATPNQAFPAPDHVGSPGHSFILNSCMSFHMTAPHDSTLASCTLLSPLVTPKINWVVSGHNKVQFACQSNSWWR